MAFDKKNIDFKKYADINAETLLAELLQNGLGTNQLNISKSGAFKKLYRKDIDKAFFDKDDQGTTIANVGINRDGIYDVLPEGLFHQPSASGSGINMSVMVAESRRLKEEEKKARLFFQPFDQEFMLFATEVEQQERHLMQQILWGNLAGDPYIFWGIPKIIPKEQATMLTGIMPWAYLIKGNADLTTKAIEMILDKKVTVKKQWLASQVTESEPFTINELTLGEDSVIGSMFFEEGLSWIFSIWEIPDAEMEYYTADQYLGKLLNLFVEIFLPVEIDVKFDYQPSETLQPSMNHILGYGFTI
jgi:hypothetical protein